MKLPLETRDSSSAKTARIAAVEVNRAVVAELGWLFREQPKDDYGIDAQVEIIDDSVVTPRLLALQIKGGPTSFRAPGPGGWWYRPNARHVRYWISHALPVVVVLVNTESRSAYWQVVTSETLARTSRGGRKILVPEGNRLDKRSRSALAEVAAGDPYVLRVRELQLARPLMQLLAADHHFMIEIEERISSTSGRGSITLGMFHPDPGYTTPLLTWDVALRNESLRQGSAPHVRVGRHQSP